MNIPTNKITLVERGFLVNRKTEVKMQQDNSYLVSLLSPVVSIKLITGQGNVPT